jgi:HTH-type transcriptional regulator / antitoxin HigA
MREADGKMTLGAELAEYADLLVSARPRSIRSEEEADAVRRRINLLIDKPGDLTEAEEELMSLLGDTLLVWEGDRYAVDPLKPLEVLRALMSDNGVRQVDLVGPVFPTRPIASQVLNGKRKLTYDFVQRLATYFPRIARAVLRAIIQEGVRARNRTVLVTPDWSRPRGFYPGRFSLAG